MVDPKRTLVSNLDRAIVKKLEVKFEENEILGMGDFDVFVCCRDMWKTELEKKNSVRQGITYSCGCTEKCMKLQINPSDKNNSNKKNKAISEACRNMFVILLDFKMRDSMMPSYQSGLGNRLCYEITFNNQD